MVEVAFVDQGYTGQQTAEAAETEGIRLEVVKLPTTKRISHKLSFLVLCQAPS